MDETEMNLQLRRAMHRRLRVIQHDAFQADMIKRNKIKNLPENKLGSYEHGLFEGQKEAFTWASVSLRQFIEEYFPDIEEDEVAEAEAELEAYLEEVGA